MRFSLWPQSLFGRLIAASVIALLLAQATSLVLVAREREHFVLQGSVREWSRRITEVTNMLQGLDVIDRPAVAAKLTERPVRFGRRPPDLTRFRNGLTLEPGMDRPDPGDRGLDAPGRAPLGGGPRGQEVTFQWLSFNASAHEFETTFEQQLRATLGDGFTASVTPTSDLTRRTISVGGPFFADPRDGTTEAYDITVKFPDGYSTIFRVTRIVRGTTLPKVLFENLALLVVIMAIVLFVVARSITRPLSDLVRAADSVGRDLRQPKLAERGARELRQAARAFNTMQDRMQRYLDSRSRVLAAMSHDLKTPLTRLRLQVELLDDSAEQGKISKQLDEMESMVNGALALFRGLDDNEAPAPLDINGLLATLQSEFAELSADVRVEGRASRPIPGKAQALRRALTNLISNAIKFGTRAMVSVEDGPAALTIHVRDEGPGIPADQLERVFEPFYRVESSRNRDTGGTGLGLSIARDVIQAHGGSLALRNLPVRGLEATVTLPR